MTRRFLRPVLATVLAVLFAPVSPAGAITLPPDFVAENVTAQPFDLPTAIAFSPTGRMFVAEKAGRVWAVTNGVRDAAPIVDLSAKVLSDGDHGLLGLAVDPSFLTNRRLYLLYTVDPDSDGVDVGVPAFGRLERWEVSATDSTTLVPASRAVLFGTTWSDGPPRGSDSHAEGALRWGRDGTLLVSLGEGAHYAGVDVGSQDEGLFEPGRCDTLEDIGAFRAQWLGSLAGKLLRLDPATGHGLPSNPFWDGDPRSVHSRVWASGLRNPFRFAIRPGTGSTDPGDGDPGTTMIGDVGWTTWEDLHVYRGGGANFGWPCREGPAPNSPYQLATPPRAGCSTPGTPSNPSLPTDPVLWWHHAFAPISQPPGAIGNSITAGDFYRAQRYPREYWGAQFVADYGQNWIQVVRWNEQQQPDTVFGFATAAGGPVDFAVHPVLQDMHFVSIATGHVRRVRYTGPQPNRAPVAVATASTPAGAMPLAVSFSATLSSDADGDPLAFAWAFGDGASASGPAPAHTYTRPGRFEVVLTADDGLGGVDRDTLVLVVTHGAGYPTTPVLDDFERANGPPGPDWSVSAGALAVVGGGLSAPCCEAEGLWRAGPAGDEQEAFVTPTALEAGARVDLILRARDTTAGAPRLRVSWDAAAQHVRVATREGGAWVERDTLEGVAWSAGQRLGARAFSNGAVQVWTDSTLRGLLSVGSWSGAADDGYVGVGIAGGGATRLDDFGGGQAVVDPNQPPVVVLTSPLDSSFFVPGDTLHLAGDATDAESPSTALAWSWRADLHHNNHVHPGVFVSNARQTSWLTDEHEDGTGWFVTLHASATDPDFHTTTRSVSAFPDVDFSASALATTPQVPGARAPFEVRFRLHNRGGALAPKRRWRLTAGGVTLAEGDTSLGARDSLEIVRRVPGVLDAGPWTLRVTADALHATVEPNENDNAVERPIEIVEGPVPDSLPPWLLAPVTWVPAATRGWTRVRTDEPSRVTVEFGATRALGDSSSVASYDVDHAFDFGPLPMDSRVWVRATLRDTAGNARVLALDSLDTQNSAVDATRPPGRLALSASRPNPARGGVAWTLDLPAATRVEFEVLDVAGRVAWREAGLVRGAGRWSLAWPGTLRGGGRAPAGLYFARVRAGERVFVRRVVQLSE